jgi:hypothetical protein
MTKAEAWRIIEECRRWNAAQTSVSLAMRGIRTVEDDGLDARRAALAEAWRTVGGPSPDQTSEAAE